jgi:NAD(P)-dependent dehydrogenase (short-subunit alcohol dehydrogenase family)
MEDFNGRVAVITGGGSGIGEGIATVLARAGAHIVIADLLSDRVEAATKRLRDATGANVLGVVTDVSDMASVSALADAAYATFGTVNLLFNNAGTTSVGTAWETPLEDYRRVLDVNLFGCVHGIQAFVARMLAGGQPGHIVNTSSMAGLNPIPLKAPYVASKFGIIGMSKSLSIELQSAKADIGVTVVCPGPVATTMTADTLAYYENREISDADRAKLIELRDLCGAHGMTSVQAGELIVNAIRKKQFWVLPSGTQYETGVTGYFDQLMREGFGRCEPAVA